MQTWPGKMMFLGKHIILIIIMVRRELCISNLSMVKSIGSFIALSHSSCLKHHTCHQLEPNPEIACYFASGTQSNKFPSCGISFAFMCMKEGMREKKTEEIFSHPSLLALLLIVKLDFFVGDRRFRGVIPEQSRCLVMEQGLLVQASLWSCNEGCLLSLTPSLSSPFCGKEHGYLSWGVKGSWM